MIVALPDDPSQATSDQVSGAVEAYNSLTPDQKKLITDSDLEKLQTALNYPATTQEVKLTSVKARKGKKAVVKWEENTSGNGYQLFCKAKGVKARKVIVDSNDTLKTKVKKLKAGKKYTFKVRVYTKIQNLIGPEESINVYGKWSNVKKAKAKK